MRSLPLYIVDAFTSRLFGGNPAAVCPLPEWLPDATMQSIASENNLSETAFFVPGAQPQRLRWFTPRAEVDFCGHATLASAHVSFEHLGHEGSEIAFATNVGTLRLTKGPSGITMRAPLLEGAPCADPPEVIRRHMPPTGAEIFECRDNYFLVLATETEVREFDADIAALTQLPFGLCITARGKEVDFVSRYFVPSFGIAEDPATGSTHATLAPLWARRLGRTELQARQLSRRVGELSCRVERDAVYITGGTVTYLQGTIRLPQ
jgi:predicted PhzF superfamily epimerase YddE/YHI9